MLHSLFILNLRDLVCFLHLKHILIMISPRTGHILNVLKKSVEKKGLCVRGGGEVGEGGTVRGQDI